MWHLDAPTADIDIKTSWSFPVFKAEIRQKVNTLKRDEAAADLLGA